ncbi:hypothetical protein DVH24_001311 [Malus domestica]|uniref:Uncharacterized protein n=1 Tax=Malus domestica TaxID=3750 RepID=A0A498K117_MALDO|nr:hypothetical protein DVH24_001311 [Malus domestica]
MQVWGYLITHIFHAFIPSISNEEGIGVEHKEHTTDLQMHNLAESTLENLLTVLPLHCNTLVSHLFQFRFPFQLIGPQSNPSWWE